jgi:hypothetical protein
MAEGSVSAEAFSRFAGSDLVRWRTLIGCAVTPRDSRWGAGRVTDVLWEGRSDDPTPRGIVRIKVTYGDGLRASVRAAAFADVHVAADVDPETAAFIARWVEDVEGNETERRRAAAAFDAALRARQDEARRARVADLRERVRERREMPVRRDEPR